MKKGVKTCVKSYHRFYKNIVPKCEKKIITHSFLKREGGGGGDLLAQSVERPPLDLRVKGLIPGVYAASFILGRHNSSPFHHSTQ